MAIARFSKDAKLKPVFQEHMRKLGSDGKGRDSNFDY
jgi:hypothetical protein